MTQCKTYKRLNLHYRDSLIMKPAQDINIWGCIYNSLEINKKNNNKDQEKEKEKKLRVVELTASCKYISNYKNFNNQNTKFTGSC